MQNALFIIIAAAVLALIGWGARDFFAASEISIWIRILIGIISVAGVILLGIVIKDRIKQSKEENFKDVDK